MGQSVAVDRDALGLKPLFGILAGDTSSTSTPAHPSMKGRFRHHVKAWEFTLRDGAVVDTPMQLSGQQIQLGLKKQCSYLILHAQGPTTTGHHEAGMAGLLRDFAQEAVEICTPRGLMVAQATLHDSSGCLAQSEPNPQEHADCAHESSSTSSDASTPKVVSSRSGDRAPAPASSSAAAASVALYVWNGTLVDPRVKARAFAKSFELHRLLRSKDGASTARQAAGPVLQRLWSGALCLFGETAPRTTGKTSSLEDVSQAAEAVRRNRNQLLVSVLDDGKSSQSPATGPPGSRRFQRVGWSVWRSLVNGVKGVEAAPDGFTWATRDGLDACEPPAANHNRSGVRNIKPFRLSEQASSAPCSQPSKPSIGLNLSGFQSTPTATVPPALNLASLQQGQQQRSCGRGDASVSLNLSEIAMSEDYPRGGHLQLKYRQTCSEVLPDELYISGYQIARDLECLQKHGITHVVNMAADVCDSCFPQHFSYQTYYLKDANTEDISVLFYQTLEWIQEALDGGGRVLVHCHEGISRSSTMVIAYLMWRLKLPYEAAHDRLRQVRPICDPKPGFTYQLLVFGKRLGIGAHVEAPGDLQSEQAQIYRIAPHHPREPFLLLSPLKEFALAPALFDPRFGWVVKLVGVLYVWFGSQVPNRERVRSTVEQHARRVQLFEDVQCRVIPVNEGEEMPDFWQALSDVASHRESGRLSAVNPAYDADFQLLCM
mmetsp:Transcript_45432/g.83101  ORF Transcript_45432/g.83101 Transcript_45432/m.83101 type:complete len:714 (-) Transcript_45432:121-2262(-)